MINRVLNTYEFSRWCNSNAHAVSLKEREIVFKRIIKFCKKHVSRDLRDLYKEVCRRYRTNKVTTSYRNKIYRETRFMTNRLNEFEYVFMGIILYKLIPKTYINYKLESFEDFLYLTIELEYRSLNKFIERTILKSLKNA